MDPACLLMPSFRGRISHGVKPPGGWKFQQGDIIISGNDWMDLIKNVREHRKANKIPLGNVEGECEDYVLSIHPHLRLNY